MEVNRISYLTRSAIFEVHRTLGPGLLESVYENALKFELNELGLHVQSQVPLPVFYKGRDLDQGFRIDLLVEGRLIIEVKSVECLINVHKKQLLTYLKLSGLRLGLLVNFNESYLRDKESIVRIIN